MAGTESPAWLREVWSRTLAEAGAPATAEETARLGAKLLGRWENPARVFHGVGHLIAVLEKLDELAQEASCPCLVRLAAFYHGAVLSTDLADLGRHTWGEDEARSAELALGQLTHLGLAEAKAAHVHDLVAALGSRPKEIKSPDLAVLCDAERSILAADPRTYRSYAAAIREECADAPLDLILRTRITVLRRWLARDRLFLTSATAAWESPARNNVEAELARCLRELSAITAPDGPAPSSPPVPRAPGPSVRRGIDAAAAVVRAGARR